MPDLFQFSLPEAQAIVDMTVARRGPIPPFPPGGREGDPQETPQQFTKRMWRSFFKDQVVAQRREAREAEARAALAAEPQSDISGL